MIPRSFHVAAIIISLFTVLLLASCTYCPNQQCPVFPTSAPRK